jgi:hypothetical protein
MNAFKLETDDTLYRIASGAAAPPDIKSDIMKAESVGKTAKESFTFREECLKIQFRARNSKRSQIW